MPELNTVRVNDLDLAYECFGDRGAPPVLMIMGLGTQMLAWPDELCEDLVARGHYVVRFDNRDVGASTHLSGVHAPSLSQILTRRAEAPYSLDDMADDALGLIEALDLGPAHLVGASLGGFIAQTMALRRPDLVRSQTLMMTSTGSRRVGQASPRLFRQLLRGRTATNADEAGQAAVDTFRLIGSPGYVLDEDRLRDVGRRSFARGFDPGGYRRQLAAALSQPNRTVGLRRLGTPTLVLHGLHDPLISVSGGIAVARAVPGARFVGFSGMGHDLPRALWPEFAYLIGDLTRRADAPTIS